MTMTERTTKTVVNVAKMKNFIFDSYLQISVHLKLTTKFAKMNYLATKFGKLVGPMRFELMTFRLSVGRSSQSKQWAQ